MNFLVRTIQDIESVFIPDLKLVKDLKYPNDSNINPFSLHPGDFYEKLVPCWVIKRITYIGDPENPLKEVEYVNHLDYKEEAGYRVHFNYDKIPEVISEQEFSKKIESRIYRERDSFLQDFNIEILDITTDARMKILIGSLLEKLEKSLSCILKFNLNKYQKLTAKLYSKIYLESYAQMIEDYILIFPIYLNGFKAKQVVLHEEVENHFGYIYDLDEHIYRDFQESFLEYEKKLKAKGYLDESNKWVNPLNDLIRFYLYLDEREFLKSKSKKGRLGFFNFISNRYGVNLGKQTNPNRIEKLPLKPSLYDFLARE